MFYLILFLSINAFSLDYKLVIRADISKPLNLPEWSKMPSTTPTCNNNGVVSKFYSFFDTNFLSPSLTSTIHKNSANFYFDDYISLGDLFLDNQNNFVFAKNYQGGSQGVFNYKEDGSIIPLVIPEDFPDVVNFSRPSLINGEVLFRSLDWEGLHKIYLGEKILLEELNDIAYLYLPTTKNDYFSMKIGYGEPGEVSKENKDNILLYQNEKFQIIAKDTDADSSSSFLSFDNSPIPDGVGGVAFIAEHKVFGRSLWHYSNNDFKLIYDESKNMGELEYFSPSVNIHGDILFRLIKDKRRQLVIYKAKSKTLITAFYQGQKLEGNEEKLAIIDRERWPAFSGMSCLSDNGYIYAHVVLENYLTKENKGSAIYQATY